MNSMLKIGATLLVFGVLLAVLGAAVFRAHAHHPNPQAITDVATTTANASAAAGSNPAPPAK